MLFYFKFFFGNFIAFLWWNVKEILQFSLVQHLEKFFHGNCNKKFLLESDRNYIPLSNGLVGKALVSNPGVRCSKALVGFKIDSAFHPFEVDKMSTRNFWELSGKK